MSTMTKGTGTLSVPAVDPRDLLLYGEAMQADRHYTDLSPFWDKAVHDHQSGRDGVALQRAMLYITTTELRGADQSRALVQEAQRKFATRNEKLMALPTDFDQVRATAPSLWDQHDHLVAVGRTLADQALGAAMSVSRLLASSPLSQLDRTLVWLFEHKTKASLVWTERSREIALNRFPWLADHRIDLKLVRKGSHASAWTVAYTAWDDHPDA